MQTFHMLLCLFIPLHTILLVSFLLFHFLTSVTKSFTFAHKSILY